MGIELRWIVRRGFAIERDQPKLPRLCSRSPDCWLERTSTACSFAFLLFGFFISTPLVTVIKDTRLKSFVTIGITRGLVGAHTKQRGREQIERSQQTRTASNWSHGLGFLISNDVISRIRELGAHRLRPLPGRRSKMLSWLAMMFIIRCPKTAGDGSTELGRCSAQYSPASFRRRKIWMAWAGWRGPSSLKTMNRMCCQSGGGLWWFAKTGQGLVRGKTLSVPDVTARYCPACPLTRFTQNPALRSIRHGRVDAPRVYRRQLVPEIFQT